MSVMQPLAGRISSATVTSSMHDHWGLFLAEGIAVIILGLAAIIVPPIAGLFATVVLGWLLLVAGGHDGVGEEEKMRPERPKAWVHFALVMIPNSS